jgi:predicted nucleic acid-binding protein
VEKLVLDTDVAAILQRPGPSPGLEDKVLGKTPCVAFVTVAEFYRTGLVRQWPPKKLAELDMWFQQKVTVIPYDINVVRTWAELVTADQRPDEAARLPHTWIASCCIHHNLKLLTQKRDGFMRFQGLSFADA